MKKNWTDLSTSQKASIEKAYRAGQEPGDIARKFGLKPKQISDQAYRKSWPKRGTKKASLSKKRGR